MFDTVMRAVPVFPSAVAVMVADPESIPETTPAAETVATDELGLDQVAIRPVSTVPLVSLMVAISCRDCPIATVADWGLTVTEATVASVTVMRAVPVFPSAVAVMVAEPGPATVTNPAAETVAADWLELDQMAVSPVSTLPFASLMVATNCRDCPIATVADWGLTVTDVTVASVTVMRAVPVLPSAVAVMVAYPAAMPVTSPAANTVADDGLELDQVTVSPGSTLPLASVMVAVSCCDCPLASAGD